MKLLTINDRDQWKSTLWEAFQCDFYHSHPYHTLAQERGEGLARMWVYRESGYMIAVPLLVRTLDDVDGMDEGAPSDRRSWRDAGSVYGYAGPLASHEELPERVIRNFQSALSESLREQGVISVFSRLHPLIATDRLLRGLGERIHHGDTVAIDLTLPAHEQWRQFRLNHRQQIKQLRRSGLAFLYDEQQRHRREFASIYTETMRRVGAHQKYFFDDAYFKALLEGHARNAHLFFLADGDRLVCGGLFLERDGIVEFHLGGTRTDALRRAPMKLLVDEVRLWANERCFRALHLGGGNDSLFHFKTGFSRQTHPFFTWQWIVDREAYQAVCRRRSAYDADHRRELLEERFFPAYRRPAKVEADCRCHLERERSVACDSLRRPERGRDLMKKS